MTKIAKWTAIGALFVIPFLPLYVADELFFPYITGKGFAFRILVELAIGAWVFLMCIDARYRPRFSYAMLLFGALTLWMLIADLLGANAHKAIWSNFERMDGWITLIHLFGFSLVASSVLAAHDLWRRWWLAFLAGSALICVYGLLQKLGVLNFHQDGRLDASFGNAAYLPAYLLFCVAIALWQAVVHKGWLRYGLLALALLQAVVIFFSATRGAFLGLIGAAAVGGLLWLVETKGVGRRPAIAALVAVLVVVGGLFLMRDTSFVQENPTVSRMASIFSVESLETRFTIWGMALKGVAERPITGWGQEGFNYVFAKHYDPTLFAQEPWFDRAHNIFLDWLIAGGVPALALFLSVIAAIVIMLYRKAFTPLERVLLIAALVAYGIQGLVVFDNLFTYVPLVAILAFVHSRASRPLMTLERLPVLNSHAKRMAAAIVAAVVTLLVVWFVNVPNILAGNDLIRALQGGPTNPQSAALFRQALARGSFAEQEIREHLVVFAATAAQQREVTDESKRDILTLAFMEMETQIALYPNDPRLHLHAATGYSSVGEYVRALEHIDAALELSPRKQTSWIQRGVLLWQGGDLQGARDSFQQAYELDSSFTPVAAYLAAGEIMIGNGRAAETLLLNAFGTTTVDSEPIRAAYYETKRYDELIRIEQLRVANAKGAPSARFGLALLYAAIGRIDAAEAEIRAIVLAHPGEAANAAALLEEIRNIQK